MKKILNFGSLNIDTVYSLPHIVRPGETLSATSIDNFFGGKGFNQSIALSRAGATVFHGGTVGKDGKKLLACLDKNGVNCKHVLTTDHPTGHAFIQREPSGQNSIVLFGGANLEIRREEIDCALADFAEGDILIAQNEIANVPYLLQQAAKKKLQIALNPSPIDDEILNFPLSHTTWLFINEIEGHDFTHKHMPKDIIKALRERYPKIKILLTLGTEGAVYSDSERTIAHPSYPVTAVDTTGAGDVFLGYFIATISKGETVETALKTASLAAALTVTKAGAMPSIPTENEVIEFEKEFAK